MDSKLEQEQKSCDTSSATYSEGQRNSILQTAQAFKSLIDSPGLDKEQEGEVQNQFSVLSSLVFIRRSLREVVEKTKFRKVNLVLIEDDAFGWARMRVQAEVGGTSVCELSVGGQSRREGVILYFKESAKNTKFELTEAQIRDKDFIDKTLRALLRVFFESVKRIVSEKESIEHKVANVLQAISDDTLQPQGGEAGAESSSQNLASVDLFSDEVQKKKKEESSENLLEDLDFFVDEQ